MLDLGLTVHAGYLLDCVSFRSELLMRATKYPASLIRVALQEPIKEELIQIVHVNSHTDVNQGPQQIHGLDYMQSTPVPPRSEIGARGGSSVLASRSGSERDAALENDMYNLTATQVRQTETLTRAAQLTVHAYVFESSAHGFASGVALSYYSLCVRVCAGCDVRGHRVIRGLLRLSS